MKKSMIITIIIALLVLTISNAQAVTWYQDSLPSANGCTGFRPNIDESSRDGYARVTPYNPQNKYYQGYNTPTTTPSTPSIMQDSNNNWGAYQGDTGDY